MKCKNCKKEISNDAPFCPHCGAKIARKNGKEPRLSLLTIVFIVLATIFVVAYSITAYNGYMDNPTDHKGAVDPDTNRINDDHIDTLGLMKDEKIKQDTLKIKTTKPYDSEAAKKKQEVRKEQKSTEVSGDGENTGSEGGAAKTDEGGTTTAPANTEATAPQPAAPSAPQPQIEKIE